MRSIPLVGSNNFIQPEQARKDVLARLKKEPLRDLSISRTTFDWSVTCPVRPAAAGRRAEPTNRPACATTALQAKKWCASRRYDA